MSGIGTPVRLTAVRRQGQVLSGWDGYGTWREVTVDERTARQTGEALCYVRSVVVDVVA